MVVYKYDHLSLCLYVLFLESLNYNKIMMDPYYTKEFLEVANLIEKIDFEGIGELIQSVNEMNFHDVPEKESIQQQQTGLIETMKSPLNIQDHGKLSWVLPQNVSHQQLMTEKYPLMDYFLNQYYKYFSENACPFSFVEIYPHTKNMKSNRNFSKGQVLLQIPVRQFITCNQFEQTRIYRYLSTIRKLIQSKKGPVFRNFVGCQLKINKIIQDLEEVMSLKSLLYIFEMKFVMNICNINPPVDRRQYAQWLYFKMLPTSFEYFPNKYAPFVKEFHEDIGTFLEHCETQTIERYKKIKYLIEGQCFLPQFTFCSFLKNEVSHGQLYQIYIAQFTPKNYVWSKNCERSRIYSHELQAEQHKQASRYQKNFIVQQKKSSPVAFIPILDLFHHSYRHANLQWECNQYSNISRIIVCKDIKCGDLLFTCYNQMPIQVQYIFYGFTDVDSECYLDLPLQINHKIIITIIQLLMNRKLNNELNSWIQKSIEFCFKDIFLRIRSNLFTRDIPDYMKSLVYMCTLQYGRIAEKLIYALEEDKDHKQLNKGRKRTFLNKNGKFLKQKQIYPKMLHELKRSILLDIKNRNSRLDQLKAVLLDTKVTHLNYDFNKHYNMKCLYTMIRSQIQLLELMISAGFKNRLGCNDPSVE